MTRAKDRAKKKAQSNHVPLHSNSHANPITLQQQSTLVPPPVPARPTSQPELDKKMVPISDKALAMLNHMLGERGMMQRDASTGAIDVVLNTELFPNLTLPFPALEIPSKGSGHPEEDIRDVLQKVAGGALNGLTGGGKLPNLEDLLKLPIFDQSANAGSLSQYLFQPHPSSAAPYNFTSNTSTGNAQTTQRKSQPPPIPAHPFDTRFQDATTSSAQPPASSSMLEPEQCPNCEQYHDMDDADDSDEFEEAHDHDSHQEGFLYGSEESFEYEDGYEDDEDEEESHLSHDPERGIYDDDEDEDEEDDDEEGDDYSVADSVADVDDGIAREDEREEARDFFSRVFGKGKQREREPLPGTTGPNGEHVCGPECRDNTLRQSSESKLQKENFYEKMKVAFMYDGWPEELLKKKWSELTDQERDYIRRTVLARATDGPICEDEKSRQRLLKKGWPESALKKRWSELNDYERKEILQVETARQGDGDEYHSHQHQQSHSHQHSHSRQQSHSHQHYSEPGRGGHSHAETPAPFTVGEMRNVSNGSLPPPMPGGWGVETDPMVLSASNHLEANGFPSNELIQEAIKKYRPSDGPGTGAAGDLTTGGELDLGANHILDENTKAEVRRNLQSFHAKASETAKWIMSHLETSSGIDPYLRGSLEEAKQVFEDFRTNFKVPDFLQEQMDVAEVMYEDLHSHSHGHGHGHSHLSSEQIKDHFEESVAAPASLTERKKKKKQKKKKKKRRSAGEVVDEDDDGVDVDVDDNEVYPEHEQVDLQAPAVMYNPEALDLAVNELFSWIKTVLWKTEQDAIYAARQAIEKADNLNNNKKSNNKKGNKSKSKPSRPTDPLQHIQVMWTPGAGAGSGEPAESPQPRIKGIGKGVGGESAGLTWTPKHAPDAEQMRERLKSVGVEVDPA